MTKNTKIILGAIALMTIVAIISAVKQNDAMVGTEIDDSVITNASDDTKTEEYTATQSDTVASEENGTRVEGTYEAYAPQKLARAETGDVVLFFSASWCPSCRSLSSDIEKNMNSIPEGVSILKVDYDKETELKKQYGVTYQHTLVQVSADGTLIKKWSGSPKLSALVAEIE